MTALEIQKEMLKSVATALGVELCRQVTFVGGCTTGLLLTDAFTREQVRHTDDVDLVASVIGTVGFHRLQQQLIQRGFQHSSGESRDDFPICAMQWGKLRVDLMPDDEKVLGFSNRWYKAVMLTATRYALDAVTTINLIHPVYFIATKLEAYRGRGKNDVLSSRDIEDVLSLIDGRPELFGEVRAASPEVRRYISQEISRLIADASFEYAVSSQAFGFEDRENLLFQRLDELARMDP